MSLRTSSALSCALLAACGSESPPPPGDTIECAIGAGAALSPVCSLEIAGRGEIVIHHPDGGFRRLKRDAATGTLAPVDGAEPLRMQPGGTGNREFAVGQDRYRIPPKLLAPLPE